MSITALLSTGMALIDKFVPDPQKKLEHQTRLTEIAQKGDLAELEGYVTLMTGQLEINKAEAQHPSKFIAGWRPAVGWTCAVSLFLAFVPKALIVTFLWAAQAIMMLKGCNPPTCDVTTFILPPFPELGLGEIIGLLMGMLGMGAMRSFDKLKRIDTRGIK